MTPLAGIEAHIDAVAAGETVEARLDLIRGSNILNDAARRTQAYFLKASCLAAGLEPLCGTRIDLAPDIALELGRSRLVVKGRERPGVHVDSAGWLVIEGRFIRHKPCRDFDAKGFPLWPLMFRNPPCFGVGPWENFRPQALELLRRAGERWPK
jgi:hypothetical protein